MALRQYCEELAQVLNSDDGPRAAGLFSKDDVHVPQVLADVSLKMRNNQRLATTRLPEPYDDMCEYHLQTVFHLAHDRLEEAYDAMSNMVQAFYRVFPDDSAWSCPLLHVVMSDLRHIGAAADQHLSQVGRKADKLEDAARWLNKFFSTCVTDRTQPLRSSKKGSTLHVINNLFKIYFKIANLRLCKNLIKAVEAKTFPDLSEFPAAEVVTYKYFVGRLAMFDGEYKRADDCLFYALQHCHKDAFTNKRLILLFLIPVRMLLGFLPRDRLLSKYNMGQFAEVVHAVRVGNLKLLTEGLIKHQSFFVNHGIYLILEKLKVITYRTLLKRVMLIKGTHKIRLVDVQAALAFVGENLDMDEIECVLANLIYQNYVKGYVSHAPPYLVVSNKGNAFPPFASVK